MYILHVVSDKIAIDWNMAAVFNGWC